MHEVPLAELGLAELENVIEVSHDLIARFALEELWRCGGDTFRQNHGILAYIAALSASQSELPRFRSGKALTFARAASGYSPMARASGTIGGCKRIANAIPAQHPEPRTGNRHRQVRCRSPDQSGKPLTVVISDSYIAMS